MRFPGRADRPRGVKSEPLGHPALDHGSAKTGSAGDALSVRLSRPAMRSAVSVIVETGRRAVLCEACCRLCTQDACGRLQADGYAV